MYNMCKSKQQLFTNCTKDTIYIYIERSLNLIVTSEVLVQTYLKTETAPLRI
jgi:hypothetical protein